MELTLSERIQSHGHTGRVISAQGNAERKVPSLFLGLEGQVYGNTGVRKDSFCFFWGGTYFIFIYVSICLCMHTPVWGPEEARGGCQVLWSECCRFKLDNCQPPAKGTGNWTWVLSWVLCKSSECFLTTEPPLRPSHIPSLGDKKKKKRSSKADCGDRYMSEHSKAIEPDTGGGGSVGDELGLEDISETPSS